MNHEDLGNYFIKNGEIYYAISYIDRPALELKNVKTGQKEVVVIGSMMSTEYSKLFEIPVEENGIYIIDKATPVENLHLESKGNKYDK